MVCDDGRYVGNSPYSVRWVLFREATTIYICDTPEKIACSAIRSLSRSSSHHIAEGEEESF